MDAATTISYLQQRILRLMNNHGTRDAAHFYEQRLRLIRSLQKRGFTDTRVLEAMMAVPREEFVDPQFRKHAYDDNALPIGSGQTISQPTIVAMMTSALAVEPSSKVLEIGTGSGYQAAVLAQLADSVISIERYPELAERARRVIEKLGIDNVEIHVGDGSKGWPPAAPYDRILVTAAAPSIPQQLLAQLKPEDGSRLVAPIGDREVQELVIVERSGGKWVERHAGTVRFVPLRGEAGWPDTDWDYGWDSGESQWGNGS